MKKVIKKISRLLGYSKPITLQQLLLLALLTLFSILFLGFIEAENIKGSIVAFFGCVAAYIGLLSSNLPTPDDMP